MERRRRQVEPAAVGVALLVVEAVRARADDAAEDDVPVEVVLGHAVADGGDRPALFVLGEDRQIGMYPHRSMLGADRRPETPLRSLSRRGLLLVRGAAFCVNS